MGHLVYDGGTAEIQMEDRTLAHLQVVIITKLRRHESFAFSWKDPTSAGDGRSTIWLHPCVSLRFRFAGSRAPTLNPEWIAELTRAGTSGQGLRVVPEPVPSAAPQAAVGDVAHG